MTAHPPPSSPPPPGRTSLGRTAFWLSPWLWAGAGMLLGALVVAGYLVGAMSGLWPWAPEALAPQPAVQEAAPLPNAGPAVVGDCRPLALPMEREGKTITVRGQICLQENGSWALAEPAAGAEKGK